jgi:hypothetical protein
MSSFLFRFMSNAEGLGRPKSQLRHRKIRKFRKPQRRSGHFGPGSSTMRARQRYTPQSGIFNRFSDSPKSNNKEKILNANRKYLLAMVCVVIALPAARAQDAPSPMLGAKEKAKAPAESKAQAKEEQAKAAIAEKKLHEPFLKRLDEAFLEQLGTPAYTPPEPGATPPARRIPPTPFDSPPFPAGDWQIGGSTIIGDPGELAPYPLMQAIYEGPGGQAWKDSKIQITVG